jgi:hypothetical protein
MSNAVEAPSHLPQYRLAVWWGEPPDGLEGDAQFSDRVGVVE